MLHILRQIAKCGIKTEPPPAPADEMVIVARLQKTILRVLGRAPGWYRRGDFANPDTPHGRTDGQACPAVPVPRAAA